MHDLLATLRLKQHSSTTDAMRSLVFHLHSLAGLMFIGDNVQGASEQYERVLSLAKERLDVDQLRLDSLQRLQ
jgi:hypothetical protein